MGRLKSIHKEDFARFGKVLEFSENCTEPFEIVITEETEPWRLAVFRYTNKMIQRMECHPTSLESFEPLSGITVLVVAEHEKLEDYEAFILDKPICLYKGIWHQVLALTDEAQVKIAENLEVNSEFYDFEKPLEVKVLG
ncbi:MAG: ureidoglycolate lyase [Lachnospiraceae bacterium]|nr:ureidoglycolate lyase [Lachnospiraceae bacterium]